MKGGRVGWKATASALYLALCTSLSLSLSDGQKTNRSFEKKKETGKGGGKAEAKISTPQGAALLLPLSGEFVVVLPTRSQICMKSPRHRGIEWT